MRQAFVIDVKLLESGPELCNARGSASASLPCFSPAGYIASLGSLAREASKPFNYLCVFAILLMCVCHGMDAPHVLLHERKPLRLNQSVVAAMRISVSVQQFP